MSARDHFLWSTISNDGYCQAFCVKLGGFILKRHLQPDFVNDEWITTCCGFSPDGSLLAILTYDGKIIIIDVRNSVLSPRILELYWIGGRPHSLCFGANKNTLIVCLQIAPSYGYLLGTRESKFISVNIEQRIIQNNNLLNYESLPQAYVAGTELYEPNKLAIIDPDGELLIYNTEISEPSYYSIDRGQAPKGIYDCAFIGPDTVTWVDEIAFRTFNFVNNQTLSYNYGPAENDPSIDYDCTALSPLGTSVLFIKLKESNQPQIPRLMYAQELCQLLLVRVVKTNELKPNPLIPLGVRKKIIKVYRDHHSYFDPSASHMVATHNNIMPTEQDALLRNRQHPAGYNTSLPNHAQNSGDNDTGCCTIL